LVHPSWSDDFVSAVAYDGKVAARTQAATLKPLDEGVPASPGTQT
jgi:hypothetical protein